MEVELQLKQVLEELNTAQLIIHMLREETSHDLHRGYGSVEPRNLIQCNQQDVVEIEKNEWLEVIPRRQRKTKQEQLLSGKRQREIGNRYKVLEGLQDQPGIQDRHKLVNPRSVPNSNKRKLKNKSHKIILIGDSHARECSHRISQHLGSSYVVTGYVTPGTGLEVITHSAEKELDGLSQKDVVIVCGGANNINKNESVKGLSCVTQFVQRRRHTNVFIMNAPHRFDLEEASCVNKEIKSFNRKLTQIMKRYTNTEVIEMGTEREHHTKHGLHMNKKGKNHITRKIVNSIKSLFAKQKPAPITLEWNKNPGVPTSTSTDQETEQGITSTMTSNNRKGRVEEETVSPKRRVQTSQEGPRLDAITTDFTHKANNDSDQEEEEIEEGEPCVTIDKRQERTQLHGITTDVTHKPNNGSEQEEEEIEEVEPLVTINKGQGVAPKRIRKQPVTRGMDFLWEV